MIRGLLAGLLLAAAAPLSAQSPALRVTDAGTGRIVEGAEVRALGGDSLLVRAIGYRVARVGRGTREVALTPLALALDRIVVTAAKREQKLADAVVTTEVISAGDIERTGASDLASALVASTGIELAGGIPSGAGLMLQGMSSSRVLILLDGQPLPGRIGGDFDLSRVPTSIVDRIEVVKGAQSALYGTDAMGGVVNIITRRPLRDGRALGANLTTGSRSRMDASVNGDLALGDVSLRGELGRRSIETTPGRSADAGALSQRLDAGASAQWRASDRTTIDVSALGLDERQRWLAGSLYNFGDNVQLTGRAKVTRDSSLGGQLSFTGFGSSYDHLSRASSQTQPIRGDSGQRQVQRLFQGEVAYSRAAGRVLIDAGMLARHDDTRSARVPGGRRSLITLEPSLQVETPLGADVTVVTGARVSRSERWGTHFTPRVAMRWDATRSVRLRASAGSGFRAPNFQELYLRFVNESAGYAIYGNENLAPERSRNLSLGAEWNTDGGYVRTQVFHNRFDGFIEEALISAPDEPLLFVYQNVDDGYTRGAEIEGATVRGGLRLDAGYSFLESRDFATGFPLSGRPKHSARATVGRPLLLGVRGSVTGIYTGRTRMQSVDGSSSWRDAYPRFDVRLARPLGSVELTFNVENVMDERPENWAGYTGRQVTIGITASTSY